MFCILVWDVNLACDYNSRLNLDVTVNLLLWMLLFTSFVLGKYEKPFSGLCGFVFVSHSCRNSYF